MALTETKIIQVENSPSIINSTNEEWGHFGWNVLSVQITHSQDTKTYTKGWDYYTGDKTVETTTINYATITYQRDKHMLNYSQIAALEQEYDGLMSEYASYRDSLHPSFIQVFKAFSVLDWIISGALLWFAAVIGGLIYMYYRYNSLKGSDRLLSAGARKKLEEYGDRRAAILRRAEQLME